MEENKTNRQFYNDEILNKIEKTINENPDLRFHQILQILGIVKIDKKIYNDKNELVEQLSTDKFHEESEKTFKNMK